MSKNKLSVEPYKGVRDFYPEDQAFLNWLFKTIRAEVERAGYVEYHASVLEPAELYKAKGAENEEIINEQAYTFTDRGGREVALRPEMTPTVARMVAARRRELWFPLRLYSIPNVFRYERPQRGRLREHWQLNVDIFGSKSLAADAEVVALAYRIMTALGARESDFEIRVGSRPLFDSIATGLGLNEEKKKRLRVILDRRDKMSDADFRLALRDMEVPEDAFSKNAIEPLDILELLKNLKDADINNIKYDPSIVRGFAYYTGTVFEVFDTHKENSRALFGGGRYDNLTALFDDEPLPGVGFGMGDVTIRDFLTVRGLIPPYTPTTAVYLAVTAPELAARAGVLADYLRKAGVNVAVDFGERKLGDQIKAAAKHKIPYLIVVGEDELASDVYNVKNLETGAAEPVPLAGLADFFKK